MSVVALAQKAGQVAMRYAPAVVSDVEKRLQAVTSGKAQGVSDIASYVGKNPSRLQVVNEVLVKAGVNPDELMPRDAMGDDAILLHIRQKLDGVVGGLRAQAQGTQAQTGITEDVIAAVVLALTRTRAVLNVYGSEENYFLAHPVGGVPTVEFALRKAVSKAMSRA